MEQRFEGSHSWRTIIGLSLRLAMITVLVTTLLWSIVLDSWRLLYAVTLVSPPPEPPPWLVQEWELLKAPSLGPRSGPKRNSVSQLCGQLIFKKAGKKEKRKKKEMQSLYYLVSLCFTLSLFLSLESKNLSSSSAILSGLEIGKLNKDTWSKRKELSDSSKLSIIYFKLYWTRWNCQFLIIGKLTTINKIDMKYILSCALQDLQWCSPF